MCELSVTSQNCLGNNLNLIPIHVWVIDKRIFSIKQILRNKQILICFKCSIYSFISLPKIKIRFSNGRRKCSLHIKGYFLAFCNVIQKRLGFRMNNCSGFYYHSFSADLTKHTVLFDAWCESYFFICPESICSWEVVSSKKKKMVGETWVLNIVMLQIQGFCTNAKKRK